MVNKGQKRKVTWVPNPAGNPDFGTVYAFPLKGKEKMTKNLNLHLSEEVYLKIRSLVDIQNFSMQDFIRQAIDREIERHSLEDTPK